MPLVLKRMIPNQPFRFQTLGEVMPVVAQPFSPFLQQPDFGTNANIYISVAFGNVPAVSGQIVFKKPQVASVIMIIIGELFFKSSDAVVFIAWKLFGKHLMIHRAIGSPGTHKHRGGKFVIQNVVAAIFLNMSHGVFFKRGPASLQ